MKKDDEIYKIRMMAADVWQRHREEHDPAKKKELEKQYKRLDRLLSTIQARTEVQSAAGQRNAPAKKKELGKRLDRLLIAIQARRKRLSAAGQRQATHHAPQDVLNPTVSSSLTQDNGTTEDSRTLSPSVECDSAKQSNFVNFVKASASAKPVEAATGPVNIDYDALAKAYDRLQKNKKEQEIQNGCLGCLGILVVSVIFSLFLGPCDSTSTKSPTYKINSKEQILREYHRQGRFRGYTDAEQLERDMETLGALGSEDAKGIASELRSGY